MEGDRTDLFVNKIFNKFSTYFQFLFYELFYFGYRLIFMNLVIQFIYRYLILCR